MWVRMFVFFLFRKNQAFCFTGHCHSVPFISLATSSALSLFHSLADFPKCKIKYDINDLISMTETSSMHASPPVAPILTGEKTTKSNHKMPNNGKAIEVIQNIIPHLTFTSCSRRSQGRSSERERERENFGENGALRACVCLLSITPQTSIRTNVCSSFVLCRRGCHHFSLVFQRKIHFDSWFFFLVSRIHQFMIIVIFFCDAIALQNMFVKFYYDFFKRLFIEKKPISF